VKFVEKRKVIRKLQKYEKILKEKPEDPDAN